MPARKPDVFVSPSNPSHEYVVRGPETDPESAEFATAINVTALTPEGASFYTTEDERVDTLKLRPRLVRTVPEIIKAANYDWALGEHDADSEEWRNG